MYPGEFPDAEHQVFTGFPYELCALDSRATRHDDTRTRNTLQSAFARFITAKARHIRSGCQNAWGGGRNGGHYHFRQLQQQGWLQCEKDSKGLCILVPPRRIIMGEKLAGFKGCDCAQSVSLEQQKGTTKIKSGRVCRQKLKTKSCIRIRPTTLIIHCRLAGGWAIAALLFQWAVPPPAGSRTVQSHWPSR